MKKREKVPSLGPLERAVMEQLWKAGRPLSIREVLEALQPAYPVTFNTVMTVMNRLVEKGLLRRSGERRSYLYAPVLSRQEYLGRSSYQQMESLLAEMGPLALARFVDAAADADPTYLRRLAELIRQKEAAPGSHEG
ncbi:MAG: BlaI/MecI/CopY family transcriptional regulator [Clostridia bacterium]|nr:BlaI/MecI/CopY family transcriptional regulator [Clostridia bacterium]